MAEGEFASLDPKESRETLRDRGKKWQEMPQAPDEATWSTLSDADKAKRLIDWFHELSKQVDVVATMGSFTACAHLRRNLNALKEWIPNNIGEINGIQLRAQENALDEKAAARLRQLFAKVARTHYITSVYSELVKGYFSKRALSAVTRFCDIFVSAPNRVLVAKTVFGHNFQHLHPIFGKHANAIAAAIQNQTFFRKYGGGPVPSPALVQVDANATQPSFDADFTGVKIEDVVASLNSIEAGVRSLSRFKGVGGTPFALNEAEQAKVDVRMQDYENQKNAGNLLQTIQEEIEAAQRLLQPHLAGARPEVVQAGKAVRERMAHGMQAIVEHIETSGKDEDLTSWLQMVAEGVQEANVIASEAKLDRPPATDVNLLALTGEEVYFPELPSTIYWPTSSVAPRSLPTLP